MIHLGPQYNPDTDHVIADWDKDELRIERRWKLSNGTNNVWVQVLSVTRLSETIQRNTPPQPKRPFLE